MNKFLLIAKKNIPNKEIYYQNFFDTKIPNIHIKRIFSTNLRGIFNSFDKMPLNFNAEYYNNAIYFYTNKLLYKISLGEEITTKWVKINIKENIPGHITCEDNNIILSLVNKNIYFFDENLNNKKEIFHDYSIVSKPIYKKDSLYFVDVSDSLVEITKNIVKKYTPEYIGSLIYNCQNNIIITDKYIIYGASTSNIFIINKSNFSLVKNINIKSTIPYIKNKPIIKDNLMIVTSDSETVAIKIDTLEILWTINKGSFSQHFFFNNYLVLGNENYIYLIEIKDDKPIQKKEIFIGSNNFVLDFFIYSNLLCCIDSSGNILVINHLKNKFNKCFEKIKTNYAPVVFNQNNKCYILILNDDNELDLFEIQKDGGQ